MKARKRRRLEPEKEGRKENTCLLRAFVVTYSQFYYLPCVIAVVV